MRIAQFFEITRMHAYYLSCLGSHVFSVLACGATYKFDFILKASFYFLGFSFIFLFLLFFGDKIF